MAPRSDARYNVPRRWLPDSSTGWNPISNPRSKRYPSGPGTAGTTSPATPVGYAANTWPPLSYRTAATMCRSVRRAERISLASATLAKASEAVLLAAMIRPRTARASRVADRSDQYWYPANAADVSSKTSPLMRTSIAVSFCLIGQSRSDISTPSRGDDLGHPQQLGADRQVCGFRRHRVDLEADPAPVRHEANHAAPFGEAVGVAHREDRPIFETREDVFRLIRHGPTDEQDVAGLDLVHALVSTHPEWAAPQTLIAHRLVQHAPEPILPEDAHDPPRGGAGKPVRPAIDGMRRGE